MNTDKPQSSAFLSFYDTHAERIYRYYYYRLRHRETAEDLTSQTFLKAWERFGTFDPSKGAFVTWLYRIARNAFIDHLRRLHPNEEIDGVADFLPSGEDVQANAVAREAVEQARTLLKHLSVEQREIITLRLWDDLSYAEIAELTGKSEAACKMAFSRSLAKLREVAGPLAVLTLLFPLIPS